MGEAATRTGRTCPNCRKFVPEGRSACASCKLEVAKFAGYEAAMRAAARKGVRKVEVDSTPAPAWRRPGPIVAVVVLGLVIAAIYVKLNEPKIPAWSKYPSTREAAATELLAHIATDKDEEFDKGYALIPPSARDPDLGDERGLYRMLFHVINQYLTGEFGDGWEKTATFTPDANDPNVLVTKVGLETLHIRLSEQTPKTILAADESNAHFAVDGIDEFNIQDAQGFQSDAARMGVVQGVAGQGAVDNIKTIIGGAGGHARETPMQKKVRLLPILHNPRETIWRTVVQTWPLRKDPVVRNRLDLVAGDDRFDPQVKKMAKDVLNETVDEAILIEVGVSD